jgi:hypothetical protein
VAYREHVVARRTAANSPTGLSAPTLRTWEGADMSDRNTGAPPLPVAYVADELALFARYGIGDLVGVEGAEARVVNLSERSDVVCPLHERRLVPDACASCRFLCGEAR